MKIIVTGGNGLLAHALKETASRDFEITFLGHADFDLTNPGLMAQRLAELVPSVVINTAAYNLVDRCEIERELSWAINATAPQQLAELCAQTLASGWFITEQIMFLTAQKNRLTSKRDSTNPLNHYAAGKFAGEQAVLRTSPQHLVLRTSWMFGRHPTQTKTFVHTVLKAAREGRALKSTTDQVSVPTFAPDLAEWTLELVRFGASGLVPCRQRRGREPF